MHTREVVRDRLGSTFLGEETLGRATEKEFGLSSGIDLGRARRNEVERDLDSW